MKLSDLIKQASQAANTYATFSGGPISQVVRGGLNVLDKSINKSSPGFKATTTNQAGVPVATDMQQPTVPTPEPIKDINGNPIASPADWYGEYAIRAQQGDPKAQQWLMENVVDDTTQDSNQFDFGGGNNVDFSTPTSQVAYSMEKLNELYGTKSPEDLWALRQKLRFQQSQAAAGMLPEEEYMRFQGEGVTDGAPRYNYEQKMGVNRATADIFGTQVADLDKFMDDFSKGEKANSTAGTGYTFGSNPALDVILGSGKFTKDQKGLIIGAIQSGQDPTTVILNQARSLMANPIATEVSKTQQGLTQLKEVQSALADYYANGGDTSLLKGNIEKVIQKLGKTKDPKLAVINSRIQKSIQKYRNAVSGTAYSVQEGQDIASIFPGINKGKELNDALVGAGIDSLQSDIDTAYSEVLGADIYNQLKSGGTKSSGSTGETLQWNGHTYKKNPDGSATLVSFSPVGSGTNQAIGNPSGSNRPQRNNNPLNIKVSSFTSKFPGVKGVDSKPAADGGKFLVFNTPQDGFNAAVKLIKEGKSYKGKTVDQALRIWSNNGYGGNIVPQYANMPIQSLPDNVLQQIIQRMAQHEGYYA